ncbi:MAG: ABC transporter substrate-binding protein, partial [Pantoea sp.]|nr:ABC transporter substrate-binding protein [Pantoea sp.]
ERDPAKQQQAYFAIQQRYDQLIPALMPISQMVDSVVVNNRVQAYQPHLSATTFLRDVWKTPESLAGGTP